MPTTTIGFGADDLPPRATAVGHFFHNGRVPAGDEWMVADNSSITGEGALGSDDTATYATADQGGLVADYAAKYPGSEPYPYMSVWARQTEPFNLPDPAPNLTVRMIATTRATWDHLTYQVGVTLYTAAGVFAQFVADPTSDPVTSDWTRHEVPPVGLNEAMLREALAARWATVQVTPDRWGPSWGSSHIPSGLDEVAFLGLALTWDDADPPILRVHPRTDGRGLSSARRVWPPSKTVQDRRWLPFGGGYR